MEGSALGALGDLPKGFPTRSSRELGKLVRGISGEYWRNQGNRGDQRAVPDFEGMVTLELPLEGECMVSTFHHSWRSDAFLNIEVLDTVKPVDDLGGIYKVRASDGKVIWNGYQTTGRSPLVFVVFFL